MRVVLLFLLIIYCSYATIEFPENKKYLQDFEIEYFYDNSNQLGIETVTQQRFSKTSSQYTFGYADGTYWFRFDIHNRSDYEKLVLSIDEPYFQEVNLYAKGEDGYVVIKDGLQVLVDNKSRIYHKPIFHLDFSKSNQQTYYVQIYSKLTTANEFILMSQNYFNDVFDHKYDYFYLLFAGALVMIVFLNCFMYFRLREKMYLFYAGYIIFYTGWLGLYSGLFLYTPFDGYFHESLITIPLFIIFLILFSVQFLNIKQYLPKWYKPLNIMGLLYLFFVFMILYDFNPWYQITIYSVILSFTLLMGVALYLWRKVRDINIRLYIIIMSIYLFTIVMLAMMVNGLIENNDFTRYAFLFASVFEILAFTLILTNRFYLTHMDKLMLKDKVIDDKVKSEKLLEERIEERTSEIRQLLEDKDFLLKELYHRVKNNFHNITSILWLESQKVNSKEMEFSYLKTISRITSMAVVHQHLHAKDNVKAINSCEYMDTILSEISKVFSDACVQIKHKVDSFELDLDATMNLSMLLNELITNSVKHSDKSCCNIDIEMRCEQNRVFLTLQDDGKGFDITQEFKGLGMSLIKQFSEKLPKGEYRFDTLNGCKYSLSFELEEADKGH